MTEIPLHAVEPIVTPSGHEIGAHRMRVPGGWIYWLQSGAGPVSSFVPDADAGRNLRPAPPRPPAAFTETR